VPPRDRPGDPWWTEAACASTDPDLFSAVGRGTVYSHSSAVTRAVAFCRRCPVRRECLSDALQQEERQHIRAGLTPLELDYVAVMGLRDLEVA
jgi:hypothetical protein